MALLNIRLSEADAQRVRSLRKQGVAISELLRETLRTEYERRKRRPLKPKDIQMALDAIDAAHPDPVDLPLRTVDPLDRQAVRKYIAARLRRKGQ